MIVIKYGGSILNPDGRYDKEAIHRLIKLLEGSQESFCLVIGGGRICRLMQDACEPLLAVLPDEELSLALDEVGIASTKINARYLLGRLSAVFGSEVCPELIIDPYRLPKVGFRMYLATGAVPGSSTDYDMMVLAKLFGAEKAIKISDFPVVLDVPAAEFRKEEMSVYQPLPRMDWEKMLSLTGTRWVPGGNYPLDPKAAVIGQNLGLKGFSLCVGQYAELEKMVRGEGFTGTVVKNG